MKLSEVKQSGVQIHTWLQDISTQFNDTPILPLKIKDGIIHVKDVFYINKCREDELEYQLAGDINNAYSQVLIIDALNLKTFKHFPAEINQIYLDNCPKLKEFDTPFTCRRLKINRCYFNSFKGIEKCSIKILTMDAKSWLRAADHGVLNLLKVNTLESINVLNIDDFDAEKVYHTVKTFLKQPPGNKRVLDCKYELMKHGYKEEAKFA